ncbi:MAG: nicotinate (nicotinamide) nucleotide adenylyltransferase [Candidatus Diapherotrites archaeon]
MIGLFGGSFNPIHKGHLQAARLVIKQRLCREIWFIPCYKHRFKPKLENFEHRVNMIKLAIKGENNFKLCLIEKKLAERRKKPNTTIETLHEIKKRYPNKKFCWIIGSDLLNELPKWYNFEELAKETFFVIVPIKGFKLNKKILKRIRALVVKNNAPYISSTKIRESIRAGKVPKTYLTKDVWLYIEKNLLYTDEFSRKVYKAVRLIPHGRLATYKDVAQLIDTKAYRAVGQVLKRNPFSTVPCHRVVKNDGLLGGFSKGRKIKAIKLKKEGIEIYGNEIANFENLRLNQKELFFLKKQLQKG